MRRRAQGAGRVRTDGGHRPLQVTLVLLAVAISAMPFVVKGLWHVTSSLLVPMQLGAITFAIIMVIGVPRVIASMWMYLRLSNAWGNEIAYMTLFLISPVLGFIFYIVLKKDIGPPAGFEYATFADGMVVQPIFEREPIEQASPDEPAQAGETARVGEPAQTAPGEEWVEEPALATVQPAPAPPPPVGPAPYPSPPAPQQPAPPQQQAPPPRVQQPPPPSQPWPVQPQPDQYPPPPHAQQAPPQQPGRPAQYLQYPGQQYPTPQYHQAPYPQYHQAPYLERPQAQWGPPYPQQPYYPAPQYAPRPAYGAPAPMPWPTPGPGPAPAPAVPPGHPQAAYGQEATGQTWYQYPRFRLKKVGERLVQKRDYLAWHNVVLTFLAAFLFAFFLLQILTAPIQAEVAEAMEDPSVTPDLSFATDPWFILFQTIILDGVIIWLTWHQVVRRRVIPRSEMGISREQLRDSGKMVKWTAIGIGFGLAFFGIATLIEMGQRAIYDPEEVVEIMPDQGDMGGVALIFIATCVLAPLSEEFFFRGYGFYAFNKRFGLFYALIFSAFLFSVAHVNIWGLLPIFVGGIGLALAFYLTRSLVTAIVAHAVYNFMVLVLYYMGIG